MILSIHWLLSATLVLLLLVVGMLVYHGTGTWLSPGAFFPFAWTALIAATLLFTPGYVVGTEGLLIILLGIGTFAAGTQVALVATRDRKLLRCAPRPMRRRVPDNVRSPVAYARAAGLLGFIGLIGPVALVHSDGQSVLSLFHFHNLLSVASENTVNRYSQPNYSEPVLSEGAFSLFFAGCSLGGSAVALGLQRFRHKMYAVFPLVPAVLTMVIETTRSTAALALVGWGATYLATTVIDSTGRRGRLSTGWLVRGAIFLTAIVAVLVGGYAIRTGLTASSTARTSNLATDTLGSTPAFTTWVAGEGSQIFHPQTYGQLTISGPIHQIFHIQKAIDPTIPIGAGTSYANSTNQLTVFGDGIRDYSLEGLFLVMFAGGIVAQHAFSKARDRSIWGIALLSATYGTILFGTAGSMFTSTVVWAGWILFVILMHVLTPRSGPMNTPVRVVRKVAAT